MERLGGSPVEDAIKLLNTSRKDTNLRLAQRGLELARISGGKVLLKNKETGEIKQTFEIETLDNPNDERFGEAYTLLAEEFGTNVLEPKSIMQEQMQGLRYGFPIETGMHAVLLTISKNIEVKKDNGELKIHKEIIGVADIAVIPLQDEHAKFNKECVLGQLYIATKTSKNPKENYRQYGFGRELMISGYEYAKNEAHSRCLQLIGAVGECTYTSRAFWEKVGWKRIYVQKNNDQSKNWKEIQYIQPPLAFNIDTGEIEEGSGDEPEHLMVELFEKDSNKNPKINEKLINIVNGIYKSSNYIPPEAFGLVSEDGQLKSLNQNANLEITEKLIKTYKRHTEAIIPHLQNFSEQLRDMNVRFLTKAEIEAEKLVVEDYITPAEADDITGKDSNNDTNRSI